MGIMISAATNFLFDTDLLFALLAKGKTGKETHNDGDSVDMFPGNFDRQ